MENLKEMEVEMLEARKAEIMDEIEAPDADLDALKEEARAIHDELEERTAIESAKVEIREAVAEGSGEVKEAVKPEERKMPTMEEIRNSKEYIEAYAEYIKTDNDAECRALLSENATGGTVPVPEFVYDIVKTAWDRDGITRRIRRVAMKGNLKVGFEISGEDAVVHTEGGNAIDPENLVLGVVELVPQTVKKVVQLSDEILDARADDFLRYVYDELTYRIAKKIADLMIAKIEACGTVSTTTCPSVSKITSTTASLGLVASAIAQLSDEAANPIVIMNKLTYAAFKSAQYAANFAADPFEGLEVEFNNSIKALSAATTGETWMIVGDLDQGALANFPNGDSIQFKFDDMTLKKQDLIEVLGRESVAIGVVAPKAFCKVVK